MTVANDRRRVNLIGRLLVTVSGSVDPLISIVPFPLHYFQAVSSSGHTGACVFPQLGRIFLFNWEIPPNVKLDMWCFSFDVNARICDFRILMPDLAK
jgi:hypothetical protein